MAADQPEVHVACCCSRSAGSADFALQICDHRRPKHHLLSFEAQTSVQLQLQLQLHRPPNFWMLPPT